MQSKLDREHIEEMTVDIVSLLAYSPSNMTGIEH